MFAFNVDCICFERGKEKTNILFATKISGVKVTPSITSVESS